MFRCTFFFDPWWCFWRRVPLIAIDAMAAHMGYFLDSHGMMDDYYGIAGYDSWHIPGYDFFYIGYAPVMVAWRDGFVIGLVYCPWKVQAGGHHRWSGDHVGKSPTALCWSLLRGRQCPKVPWARQHIWLISDLLKWIVINLLSFHVFSILFLAFQSWLQFVFWNVYDKLNRNHPLRQSFSDFEWECAADSFAWPGNMQAGHCAF